MNVSEVWILVSVYLIKALLVDVVESGESCMLVQNECYRRTGCSMALHNFFSACHSVIHGESKGCTVGCKRALISLLTTEDRAGSAFMNCDCRDDKECKERKRHVEVCTDDVLGELDSVDDNTTRVSCTLAKWTCEADTSCFVALTYYAENCKRLMSGDKCTPRCNNSLNVLHQQFKAKKLQTCACDGTESYDCERIKEFTEELCYHRTYHVKVRIPPSPSDCDNSAHNKCDKLFTCTGRLNRWLLYIAQTLSVLILLEMGRTS